jgi:hypothetical protein
LEACSLRMSKRSCSGSLIMQTRSASDVVRDDRLKLHV